MKSPWFILTWDPEATGADIGPVKRIAVGIEEAAKGVEMLLGGEQVFDEDANDEAKGEHDHEDFLHPALWTFIVDVTADTAGDDPGSQAIGLRLWLGRMKPGDSEELECEGGTFSITRDR
jgi:hypothetical protein